MGGFRGGALGDMRWPRRRAAVRQWTAAASSCLAAGFDVGDLGLRLGLRLSVFLRLHLGLLRLGAPAMAAAIRALLGVVLRQRARPAVAALRSASPGLGRSLLARVSAALAASFRGLFLLFALLRGGCGTRSARAPVGGGLFALARPDLALGRSGSNQPAGCARGRRRRSSRTRCSRRGGIPAPCRSSLRGRTSTARKGCRSAGQALAHSPQRMQGISGGGGGKQGRAGRPGCSWWP
jgi:hypothetical protein